jgi:hypothetical protein
MYPENGFPDLSSFGDEDTACRNNRHASVSGASAALLLRSTARAMLVFRRSDMTMLRVMPVTSDTSDVAVALPAAGAPVKRINLGGAVCTHQVQVLCYANRFQFASRPY